MVMVVLRMPVFMQMDGILECHTQIQPITIPQLHNLDTKRFPVFLRGHLVVNILLYHLKRRLGLCLRESKTL